MDACKERNEWFSQLFDHWLCFRGCDAFKRVICERRIRKCVREKERESEVVKKHICVCLCLPSSPITVAWVQGQDDAVYYIWERKRIGAQGGGTERGNFSENESTYPPHFLFQVPFVLLTWPLLCWSRLCPSGWWRRCVPGNGS